MIVGEGILVMLLVEEFFKTFTPNQICDTTKDTEMLIYLSCESRDAVDALVRKAVGGAAAIPTPPRDQGFMYWHGYQDLDGHLWELLYMDMSAMPKT